MNKKAIFMTLFSFFILIVLNSSYYLFMVKGVQDQYKTIGSHQAEIINSYNQGYKYSLNSDLAVKYASHIATVEFSKNGGIKESCNNFWKYNSECRPELNENFILIFKNELENYGYKAKEVKIENNFLIVQMEDFIHKKELDNFNMKYELPVEIKKEMPINLIELNNAKEKIKNCLNNNKGLNTCIDAKTQIQGDYITFSIENNKNILIYTDKLEIKKLEFMFKINIKDTGIKQGVF